MTPISTILTAQSQAERNLEKSKTTFRRATRKNAVAIGRHITALRDKFDLSRAEVGRALGTTNSNLFAIEHPDRVSITVSPRNQMRYLQAIEKLGQGIGEARSSVEFRKLRGRPSSK